MDCWWAESLRVDTEFCAGSLTVTRVVRRTCRPDAARLLVDAGRRRPGAVGTARRVRDALWVLLGVFAAAAGLLLTPDLRGHRDLPAPEAAIRRRQPE